MIGAWEVKLEIMTDRPTDRRAHREVSLPKEANMLTSVVQAKLALA